MECTVQEVIGGVMFGTLVIGYLIAMVQMLGWKEAFKFISFVILLILWVGEATYLLEACK